MFSVGTKTFNKNVFFLVYWSFWYRLLDSELLVDIVAYRTFCIIKLEVCSSLVFVVSFFLSFFFFFTYIAKVLVEYLSWASTVCVLNAWCCCLWDFPEWSLWLCSILRTEKRGRHLQVSNNMCGYNINDIWFIYWTTCRIALKSKL